MTRQCYKCSDKRTFRRRSLWKVILLVSLLAATPSVLSFQNAPALIIDTRRKGNKQSTPLFYSAYIRPTPVAGNNTNPLEAQQPPSALLSNSGNRAADLSKVLFGEFLNPVVSSLLVDGIPKDWNTFWSQTSGFGKLTNAQRLASAVEHCGPTYVKFAQAVSSRPDIVPKSLADALSKLQDDMEPFDSDMAKDIVRNELLANSGSAAIFQENPEILEEFLESLSSKPVAAASVGQVYSAHYPGFGKVAVKVKRPGIHALVEQDAALLRSVATWIESIPSITIPGSSDKHHQLGGKGRLIATELVSSVDEFMSRLFEELDYRNEAANMEKFASLYCVRRGTSKKVKVIVPEVVLELCTDNVIVMEWIEGTKLTNVVNSNEDGHDNIQASTAAASVVAENLALVELCIQCTLSQLLDTGYLHADPHGGNLLKVKIDTAEDDSFASGSPSRRKRFRNLFRRVLGSTSPSKKQIAQLGYLDFGMLSTVDPGVRDALVCAIVLLVFARDVEKVANMFGELQLLPDFIVSDKQEMAALTRSLNQTFDEVLIYPDDSTIIITDDDNTSTTQIPSLRFDKLLDALSRLVPRFQFDLPPYFLNNARALSTLEGIARSLDPTFSVLQVVYPYALNRLMRNPSGSQVVEDTLQGLIRSPETGLIDRTKVSKMLDDAALITGFKRRKVLLDVLSTRGGLRLARMILADGLTSTLFPRRQQQRRRRRSF